MGLQSRETGDFNVDIYSKTGDFYFFNSVAHEKIIALVILILGSYILLL